MEGAVEIANQMLNQDIPTYFGHLENDISIEPMLIILNQKFDTLSQMQLSPEATQAEKVAYGKLF